MLRDIMKVIKVTAPGTANFTAALGPHIEAPCVACAVLLQYTDVNGVSMVRTGAAVSLSGTTLSVTKATAQAATDIYVIGLVTQQSIPVVAGE